MLVVRSLHQNIHSQDFSRFHPLCSRPVTSLARKKARWAGSTGSLEQKYSLPLFPHGILCRSWSFSDDPEFEKRACSRVISQRAQTEAEKNGPKKEGKRTFGLQLIGTSSLNWMIEHERCDVRKFLD